MTPRLRRRLRVVILGVTTLSSSCLFLPAIDDDGYAACERDADCAVGRACIPEVKLCAPPPWNDTAFTGRQLLVVDNTAGEAPLPAGAAVPITVGGEGAVLALQDVAADARFTDFDFGAGTWRTVGVYRDLFADRFTVWAPLPRAVPAGGRGVLVWLEQGTATQAPTVLEDPATAFALFDDLDTFVADRDAGERYLVVAPPAQPVVGESQITVGDNTTVIWRQGLVPPIDVTFRARVNGTTCGEVFIGLVGDDDVGFNPPSAGFFVSADLATVGEVAPTATSNPTGLSSPRVFSEQATVLHRFRVQADGATVRFFVDDVVFDERTDLRPPFDPEAPLFPTVQVGGACSVDLEAVWVTPLPSATSPTVSAEAPVLLNITF